MEVQELNKALGNIDIYLLDQILKGRFNSTMKILDAGCGEGRNIMYFLRNNYEVSGIDTNPDAIRMLQFVARSVNPNQQRENFKIGNIESMPYENNVFDATICSAVLHFAKSDEHFNDMMREICRVTKPSGTIFIRTASSIGIENFIEKKESGCYNLPDGSSRYLVHRNDMRDIPNKYGVEYLEPFKTVNVADQRCMTNLILRKL